MCYGDFFCMRGYFNMSQQCLFLFFAEFITGYLCGLQIITFNKIVCIIV